MKKYLLFLCVFVILGACTNTIGYLPDDEPKKLIVNAMMQTENNDNRIYLHYTGWTATTPVTDGIIHLYINGKLSETITAEDDYYPVKSIFRTGDKVKIEASSENGKYKAKAETRISAPLQIINVDTTYISLRDYNSWVGGKPVYDNYLRLNIQLKQPDIEAENTYYRLEIKQIFYSHKWHDGRDTLSIDTTYNYISLRDYNSWVGGKPVYDNYLRLNIQLKQPDIEAENTYYRLEIKQIFYSHKWHDGRDTLSIDTTYNYNYIYDTALTDGKPGHAIDEGFELIQKWNNYFGLFKSCYFKNREYNMTIDLKEDINYIHIDSQKAERYISIRFYSISESEHRYLYAMSSALDFDAENFIYAVPLIPNNIKGGIGIFSIANQVKYKLKEENCQDRY